MHFWGGVSHHLEPELVERVLHMTLRRFGVPQRIYLGAGGTYRKRWVEQVCGRTGIHLLRTAPRSSRCMERAGGRSPGGTVSFGSRLTAAGHPGGTELPVSCMAGDSQ